MNPIKAMRVWWRLRPLLKELEGLFAMKKTTQVWMSIIAVVIQMIAQLSPLLPDETKHWMLGAHIVLEAILKILAFSANPDGTPAEMPYQPKGKL